MLVKVKNVNVHAYSEVFEGEKILIQPGQWIEMDAEKANKFLGTFKPPLLDVNNQHKPEGFKMLKILSDAELHEVLHKPLDENKCLACSYNATGKADLAEHVKTHAGALVVDEAAEKDLAARPKRGRPPKSPEAVI